MRCVLPVNNSVCAWIIADFGYKIACFTPFLRQKFGRPSYLFYFSLIACVFLWGRIYNFLPHTGEFNLPLLLRSPLY